MNLMSYNPLFMRKGRVLQEIYNADEIELEVLNTDIVDIKNQLSIDSATWGLEIYEKELNILIDINKPIEDRRSVIKSKMRGTGKVDAILIKLVADAYTNGDVVVSFNGHIVVKFTSKVGTPTNIEDLKEQLEDIKPAYLAIDYEFRYISISEINQITISQLNNTILDKFAMGG